MNWEAVLSASLAASVSLNIGLIIRDSQLSKLKEWITGEMNKDRTAVVEAMRKDRHDMRNEMLANTVQIADLHSDVAQLVALKHPALVGKLPRPLMDNK